MKARTWLQTRTVKMKTTREHLTTFVTQVLSATVTALTDRLPLSRYQREMPMHGVMVNFEY